MNPLPLALTPKKILLIGAGKVAAQKARAILESDCPLFILAKEVRDDYFLDKEVKLAPFSPQELEGFDLIIDATGDEALGRWLWEHKKEYRYWLNVVDVPALCDFYFSATVRRGDLCVSVSSGGASPTLAQGVRDKIARFLPSLLAPLLNRLKEERQKGRIDPKSALPSIQKALGKVFLIGCGPHSVGNLTLKALETIEILDVALIDALVGEEILNLLPPQCLQVSVSKQKGCHSYTQEEINELMLRYAKEGLNVGRLKGGDPMVFGRVAEEAGFLMEQGIEVELLSGVTSFLAGCLQSGITPTLRGVSAGALVVSAHLKESRFHDEWLAWLKDSPYTLVVLMAHSFAREITLGAKNRGVPLTIPAAFVSKIDSPSPKSVIGNLGCLEEMAKECEKPAILVIGEAVKESLRMPYIGERVILE